jgi:hypothetical protein
MGGVMNIVFSTLLLMMCNVLRIDLSLCKKAGYMIMIMNAFAARMALMSLMVASAT